MRKLFYLGFAIIMFASCEKNDSNPVNDNVEKTDYLPLEIGNYWIYKHYDIDSSGNETEGDRIDSVIINRDTTINNNQFFILEGTNYPYNGSTWGIIDILRDSSGYIVNEEGQIRFSEDNFTDILASKVEVINADTVYTLIYKMEVLTNTVSVPAGEFEVLNFKGTVTTLQQIPGTDNPRFLNNLYSKKVGKVLQTYFYLHSPIIGEKRLVRYNIEKE